MGREMEDNRYKVGGGKPVPFEAGNCRITDFSGAVIQTPRLTEEPILFHLRHSEGGQTAIERVGALIQNWLVVLRALRRCDFTGATGAIFSTMRVQRAGFLLSKGILSPGGLACQVLNTQMLQATNEVVVYPFLAGRMLADPVGCTALDSHTFTSAGYFRCQRPDEYRLLRVHTVV
jgi:hypothetical protein